jgi:hypothetical protein
MQSKNSILSVPLLAIAVFLTACGGASDSKAKAEPPSRIEKVGDAGSAKVILADSAAKRLGVRTEPVKDATAPTGRVAASNSARQLKSVPYSAVVYDTAGKTWSYLNPEPLVFVRSNITVLFVEKGIAYLSEGPATGSLVVTVGAAELYGAELGVGK